MICLASMTSLEDNDVDMFLEERFHELRISSKMSVVSPPNGSVPFSMNSPRNRRFGNPFDVPLFLIKSEQKKTRSSAISSSSPPLPYALSHELLENLVK
eukprot:TRINITY_DN7214_c0_g1_i1.p1 TRINITY_DN7214_c0_g1~~TRINITY_DN7214_c0_g1_i1.p1  ORF type:complete len:99 (-),score=9.72 TRINITY_DN7214_c0_g1_i1:288-584(-)